MSTDRLGKLYSYDEIIDTFKDGQTIILGGGSYHGNPNRLIDMVLESGVRHLTTISIDAGIFMHDVGKLCHEHRVDKMITSHIGNSPDALKQFNEGKLEVEFCPAGTLIERLRAGGMGIPAFYVKTGMYTGIEKGKEIKQFNGEDYMMETALTGDIALVRCRAADPLGNLSYHGTSENSNPIVALNPGLTIVEPDIILEIDEIGYSRIKTPGVYVDMILNE